MRTAVIDIGTNTMLLLIAELRTHNNSIKTILDIQQIPRLGKGVDENRHISHNAIIKAIFVLNDYKKIIEEYGTKKFIATATSFLRDSVNKDEFMFEVHKQTGIKIELLSGEDEAKWTFLGGVYDKLQLAGDKKQICTIDIGGGSTEITYINIHQKSIKSVNDLESQKMYVHSYNFGSVRIFERFLRKQPAKSEDIIKAQESILSEYKKNNFDFTGTAIIGLAGTITTLAAMKLSLKRFDSEKVDGMVLSIDDINILFNELKIKSYNKLLMLGDYMEGRADILLPGVLILKIFMEYYKFNEITVSTKGLRYGILLREILNENDINTFISLVSS